MSDLILHHYDPSPFGEKIRTILGFKGVKWKSVQIPRMMPKPDLMPLTGGYRKTPVLQIGSHIYCDTQIIIRYLQSQYSTPTLFPDGSDLLGWGTSFWTDKLLFSNAVGIVFGAFGDKMPEEFIKDRAEYSGGSINIEKMKAALPYNIEQFKAQVGWIEEGLKDGRNYILGDAASMVDFNLYYVLWFAGRVPQVAEIIGKFPGTAAWMARIKEIGHGDWSELSATEALVVAKEDDSSEYTGDVDVGEQMSAGDQVVVMPNDSGRVPVTGELITLTNTEIAIRYSNDATRSTIIHFPRAGFLINPV